jgi:hypothetical protein
MGSPIRSGGAQPGDKLADALIEMVAADGQSLRAA